MDAVRQLPTVLWTGERPLKDRRHVTEQHNDRTANAAVYWVDAGTASRGDAL